MSQQRLKHYVSTLLLLLVLFGTGGQSAAALSPQTSVAAVAATPALHREVFGFALASSLSDPTIGYPSWNFTFLSTVAFFGLHVNGDGTFANDSGMSVWNSSQLTSLVSVAHSNGTRVVVTVVL